MEPYSTKLALAFGAAAGLQAIFCEPAFPANEPERTPVEHFVSPTGSVTNNGTLGLPWPSVAFALSHAGGGDTITLLPGTYSEAVVLELSGTPERPTVLRSQRKWEAILKGSPSHGIYVADGVTNVVIDGLQVAGAAQDGVKVGARAVIRNCWIHHSGGQGVSAHQSRDTVIERNLIEQNGTSPRFDHGLYLNGTNLVVRNNVIRGNQCYGCQFYSDFPGSTADCWFYNNLVYGNRDGLTVWSPRGQTNYVLNNTILSDRYVLIADYGVLCVTNNILMGTARRYVLTAGDGAVIRADYNLTPIPGGVRGPHDVVGDPGFVKPDAGLFWLRADSRARGASAPSVALPVDFFGQARPRVLDVGAFAYRAECAADRRVLHGPDPRPDYWHTHAAPAY